MFIEQAFKGNNEWWRVAITVLLSAGIFILNFIALFFMSDNAINGMYETMREIPNNLGLAINLIPFAFLLGLLFVLVYAMHQRGPKTLTTAHYRVNYGKFFFSLGLISLITLVGFAVSYYFDSSNIVWNFNPVNFAILVVISLLLFPLQIGFEEYLFRGYLMQQIGIIARNRWFPLVMTSILFGLAHSANPEVAEMGFGVMAFYIGTGLLLGIMTLMDEGLELALGFHLGNNLLAALLITSDFSALQTDAIFKYSGAANLAEMLNEMIITMAISYPLVLLILARKYKWSKWREKLTGKVTNNLQTQIPNHDGAIL